MYLMRPDQNSRQGLIDLCNALSTKGEIRSIVEVGSFAGESAEILHDCLPKADIFCVDPWRPGYDDKDIASSHDMSQVESAFDKRTAACERILKLKGISRDFEDNFEPLSVDAVYLDGCHTYESLKDDIEFWLSRCRLAICGHDYTENWPEVVKAVDDVFNKPDHVFSDGSWLKWLS